ncbi:hypothetical protein IFM89_036125 [Coptis chinensis]|uniref:Iron hydrogenase large subunit C-terminal domain-containing protein n=1 Tax=Coptis chinensis TaxID=261450 RepID=A0A835HRT0_9MAGN|nr:hypothetical protein IFM89_036125 [Coptis chinensis]
MVLPDKIYHVTVMPCYDKKLEASRDDFVFTVDSGGGNANDLSVSEVDSVLTSGEVMDLIQLKSVDFKALEESPLDELLTNVDKEGKLYGVSGSSGGYAETIFRHAAKTLFGRQIDGSINFKTIRNSDFREVILEVWMWVKDPWMKVSGSMLTDGSETGQGFRSDGPSKNDQDAALSGPENRIQLIDEEDRDRVIQGLGIEKHVGRIPRPSNQKVRKRSKEKAKPLKVNQRKKKRDAEYYRVVAGHVGEMEDASTTKGGSSTIDEDAKAVEKPMNMEGKESLIQFGEKWGVKVNSSKKKLHKLIEENEKRYI